MTSSNSCDQQEWLNLQMRTVDGIFDRAVEELDIAGVHILPGSWPPVRENLSSVAQIVLTPLRYTGKITSNSLALTLTATATNGPRRYIVGLRMLGEEPTQALARLTNKNPDIWRANYLDVGLWIKDGEHEKHLNAFDQLQNHKSTIVGISGVLLHSSSGYAVQAGLMSIAVLYRSLLDELSETSKMSRHSTCVLQHLDGRRPKFDRIFRP